MSLSKGLSSISDVWDLAYFLKIQINCSDPHFVCLWLSLLTPGAYLASGPTKAEGLITSPEVSWEVSIGVRDSPLKIMVESMTDSMVVDSSTMGVSMVDMEAMEVGIRGREFSWREEEAFGEEAEGNLAGLFSLSIVITFANAYIGRCGWSFQTLNQLWTVRKVFVNEFKLLYLFLILEETPPKRNKLRIHPMFHLWNPSIKICNTVI